MGRPRGARRNSCPVQPPKRSLARIRQDGGNHALTHSPGRRARRRCRSSDAALDLRPLGRFHALVTLARTARRGGRRRTGPVGPVGILAPPPTTGGGIAPITGMAGIAPITGMAGTTHTPGPIAGSARGAVATAVGGDGVSQITVRGLTPACDRSTPGGRAQALGARLQAGRTRAVIVCLSRRAAADLKRADFARRRPLKALC